MIDTEKGLLKIGDLIISSRTSEEHFTSAERFGYQGPRYHAYRVFGSVFGRPSVAVITFDAGRLQRAGILLVEEAGTGPNEWGREQAERLRDRHDALLLEVLGEPPYEYPWGRVVSEISQQNWEASISVEWDN